MSSVSDLDGISENEWQTEDLKPDAKWPVNRNWQHSWKPDTSRFRQRRVSDWIKNFLNWRRQPSFSTKAHPTAYLDGLRGFAAFLVYWHHHELWAHGLIGKTSMIENGFGYNGNYTFISFPGIRTFFAGGHYAVATFFVISGYVLSIKPLSLLHSGNMTAFNDHLASALFRRWIRLYIPLFITMLAYAMSWHILGIWVRGKTPQSTWTAELWAFYCEFKNFSFVFKEGGEPGLSYNTHSWSIPAEFRGSIVIYTSLLAFSRCSRQAYLWCQAGLIFYFMYIADASYCAFFVAGSLLRHLDQLSEQGETPKFLEALRPFKTPIFYHLFAFSVFLGGIPAENRDVNQLAKNRGWYYLSFLKPQAVFDYKWFYLFWAGVFLVASVPRIPWLKRFFETRFCQYLGRISYALYLVHGPLLGSLGDRLYVAAGWHDEDHVSHIPQWVDKFWLPKKGLLGLEVSFVVPHIVLLPLTLCLADLVTRAIDTQCVRFASWFYRQVSADVGPKQAKA